MFRDLFLLRVLSFQCVRNIDSPSISKVESDVQWKAAVTHRPPQFMFEISRSSDRLPNTESAHLRTRASSRIYDSCLMQLETDAEDGRTDFKSLKASQNAHGLHVYIDIF